LILPGWAPCAHPSKSFCQEINRSEWNMKPFSICLLLACCLPARAQTNPALTLDAVVRAALERNPALLASRQRIRAATGHAVQARLWDNPVLELSAEDMPSDHLGLSRSKNLAGISQTVPFPGKKSLDVRSAGHGVRAAESEARASELELIRDVKIAYYRALAADRRLAIAQQLVELAESLATAAGKRVEAGAAAAQEQLRAEIESERARAELAGIRRERAEARQALATLMGQPGNADFALAGELSAAVEIGSVTRDQLLRAHPRLTAAMAERDRAESELRRARLDPWPDVTLGIAAGREAASNEDVVEFRVSLPLPLLDHGQGRQREAKAKAAMAGAELMATEHRLLQDLVSLEARLRAAAEQVTAYRGRILPKAEEALRLVQGGFEAGKFGFIDLLDTQRSVAEARLAYQEKLLELNSARAELEAWQKGTQP
jgi:cobalt-zinc-cadmium efflux system outer membrane protein